MPVELVVDDDVDVDRVPPHSEFDEWIKRLTCVAKDPQLARPICIRICGIDESQRLNAAYRGKNVPTNVLSFPSGDFPSGREHEMPLGDVAVCWQVLVSEAVAQNKSTHDHLAHLVVHGVLHLLGMDHQNDREAEGMEALEIAVLATIGVANPYEPA